ncbi:MAG: putative basic amino acid antiporter YfcC [Deltaproteobacteria bacterium]|nr:putative basic amino acid antiporter YfcC [Deltaproteobacteria bacterium]
MLKKIPNVFTIVFALIVIAAVATWIVPGGEYKRQKQKVGDITKEVLIDGSFRYVDSKPQMLEIFTAPAKGFLRLAEIIAFIFIVGGAFFMFNETNAITAGIHKLVGLLKGREFLVIPIVMTLFSLFGAAFGMCEEAMPFVLIFVPMALSLGYDSIVGVCMTFLAAGVGFAGAFLNPFTLQIAQGLAGLEPLSGQGYRVLIWFIITAFTIGWVMIYAAKIKRNPEKSPMYELDKKRRVEISKSLEKVVFTWRHAACLGILLAGMIMMVVGVVVWEWYIKELAGLFFAMGLAAGITAGLGPDSLAKSFIDGCKDIVSAALVVGFAGGILVILEDGRIMDTILHSMASVTSEMPKILAADVQYGLQMLLNFFIPSGSTKAALTMPIMAPLADLSGITRQTAVLAYQFGDGFTNMIIPTSGVTVGTLAMAKIPFERWFKWNFPMQIAFFVMSLLFLIWPVLTGWS